MMIRRLSAVLSLMVLVGACSTTRYESGLPASRMSGADVLRGQSVGVGGVVYAADLEPLSPLGNPAKNDDKLFLRLADVLPQTTFIPQVVLADLAGSPGLWSEIRDEYALQGTISSGLLSALAELPGAPRRLIMVRVVGDGVYVDDPGTSRVERVITESPESPAGVEDEEVIVGSSLTRVSRHIQARLDIVDLDGQEIIWSVDSSAANFYSWKDPAGGLGRDLAPAAPDSGLDTLRWRPTLPPEAQSEGNEILVECLERLVGTLATEPYFPSTKRTVFSE